MPLYGGGSMHNVDGYTAVEDCPSCKGCKEMIALQTVRVAFVASRSTCI